MKQSVHDPARNPTARRVWVAINAAERMICGNGAVHSAAMAEGLALAGARAAHLLDPGRDELIFRETVEAPWVDHRIRSGRAARGQRFAFELIASTAQEAVDHCLLAHRLVARLGSPGLCTIDADLAESTAVVQLPTPGSVAGLPPVGRTVSRSGPDRTVDETLQTASAEVSEATGRQVESLAGLEAAEARFVLLAAGSSGPAARRLASGMRRLGIPCGALVATVLDPFPEPLLRQRLKGVEAVAVLSSDLPGVTDLLERHARRSLKPKGRVAIVDAGAGDRGRLHADLEAAFDCELPDLEYRDSPSGEITVLGGLPGTDWTEEFLLDAVAWVGWLGTPQLGIDVPGGDLPRSVVVGAKRRDERLLNLLAISRPEALNGVAPLNEVRERGLVLFEASSGDPGAVWARLSPDQRATMLRRRLRLGVVSPENTRRRTMECAVLAGVPELARTIDSELPILEALGSAPLPDGHRRSLAAAAGSLAIADPEELGEPEAVDPISTSGLARMPSATTAPAEERPGALSPESLRRFHYENHTADAASESAVTTPLRPTLLETLETASPPADPEADGDLLALWASRVLEDRRRRRETFRGDLESLARAVRETLGIAYADPAGPDLTAGLGQAVDLFDAGSLSQRLAERRRPAELGAEREGRLVKALDRIEVLGRKFAWGPVAYLIYSGNNPTLSARHDVEIFSHSQGLSVAVGLFDGLAQDAAALFRALRIAGLEVGGRYDEETHGPSLERLDWQSLTPDELLCMPLIAVLESAGHLRGPALGSFSQLIRAGRPIHVLVDESVADLAAEILEPPFGYQPALGYLAVAHREALVVHSSLGRREHLLGGIDRVVTSLDPAIVIAAAPTSRLSASAAVQLEGALQARATPLFVYDPSGGSTWAERFSLDGNPQPDRPWPIYPVAFENDENQEQSLELAFTPAHVAALDPAWRGHFRIIAPEAWSDEQVEIGAFLTLTDGEKARHLPYIWIVEKTRWARAIVSWELAFACRDCGRAWRILQELGGTDNAYASRAAAETRRVLEAEFDGKLEQREAEFAVALESARGAAAASAIERLVATLADPSGLHPVMIGTGGPTSAAPVPGVAASAAGAAAATPVPATAPSAVSHAPITDPYIDSFLCTTCNDCIDINPRLFHYNGDKQAEIADASTGTFKELVKAAEACPARCIHPGAPRPNDGSATPALIERAAKFN